MKKLINYFWLLLAALSLAVGSIVLLLEGVHDSKFYIYYICCVLFMLFWYLGLEHSGKGKSK